LTKYDADRFWSFPVLPLKKPPYNFERVKEVAAGIDQRDRDPY
jgi:hypothetical protein